MKNKIIELENFINKNFLVFLILSYILALITPMFGQQIRDISVGQVFWLDGSKLDLTLPLLMLAFVLFNAGLGVKSDEIKQIAKSPKLIILGLIINSLIPIIFIFLSAQFLNTSLNFDQSQSTILGLALIASMPIAGSSSAWTQNSNGNLSLSLGLVLFSTLLSPILTPLALKLLASLAQGEYAFKLRQLAETGANSFLILSVVIPSLAGILGAKLIGEQKIVLLKPFLRLSNAINMLLLIYSNAAAVLPNAFFKPDFKFLIISLIISLSLCILAFLSGLTLANILKTPPPEKSALVFGLGMNNNGTGLVLASLTLKAYPNIMLPIIFYNLGQQFIAGLIDWLWKNKLSKPKLILLKQSKI